MARLLSFTYAGLTIGNGGSADYHLTGRYRFTRDYERATLTFEVVVQNDDPDLFLAAEAALVSAFSMPDQTLVVVLGASTRHSFSPAANTGFNTRANARKLGGQEDTARSARYECTVTVELPATLAGRAGRRTSAVNVATSPSGRRTVTISGTYTALGNRAAREQFAAAVTDYCNGVLSGLGGTWELVGTPQAEADDQDKVIRFQRVYREILYPQAQGKTDHAAIIDPKLTFRVMRSSGDFAQTLGSAAPLIDVTATYEASVAFDETTDLRSLYESTIRPYILDEAQKVAGASVVVIVSEAPEYDPGENVLRASIAMSADPGTSFLLARTSVSDSIDKGLIFKPVYNGNPWARDVYRGHGSWVRTLTRTTVARGSVMIAGSMVVSDHGDPPQFPGFVEVRELRQARPWSIGLPGLAHLDLRATTTTYTYVRADEAPITGGTTERGTTLGIDPGDTGFGGSPAIL